MLVLTGERTGRTTKLIELAAEQQLCMVVATTAARHAVLERARELGKTIPTPLTFEEFLSGHRGRSAKGVLIDNADQLLQGLSHLQIYGVSV